MNENETTTGDDMERPCFVFGPKGVSCEDGWCYDKSAWLGNGGGSGFDAEREIVKSYIRAHPETNGLPCYMVSDHGNVHRTRAIRLRFVSAERGA